MFDLRARREQLKISQDQVAKATGVSRGTVSKWESGNIANMKRDKIAALAKLLRISPLEVLGLEETNKPANVHSYPYIPADIAAGVLTSVDPFTHEDIQSIELSDTVLGRYAGEKDVVIMNINGESMNRTIPNHSLIAVRKINDVQELNDGDIVVFSHDGDYSIKYFYNDQRSKTYTFSPDSTNKSFKPMVYRYEDADGLSIFGKVIVYTVIL